MAGPAEDDGYGDVECDGIDDEGMAGGVGGDELVLRHYLVEPLVTYIIGVVGGCVEADNLHHSVEVFVECLFSGCGESGMLEPDDFLLSVGGTAFIALEYGFGFGVEWDGEGVVGLDGGEGDAVAVDVGTAEFEDVGRAESGVTTEDEDVASDVVMWFVELEVFDTAELVAGEVDDGAGALGGAFDFGAILLVGVAVVVVFAPSPVEEPAHLDEVAVDGDALLTALADEPVVELCEPVGVDAFKRGVGLVFAQESAERLKDGDSAGGP